MTRNKSILVFFACVIMVTLTDTAWASDGASSFESFYKSDININWVLAGLGAVVVSILVFVGWPVLGPAMTATLGTIGTSIGGLFGFTGVAATNFGLALLGGGAVVSGGFGIAGGTAVLAAALSFSTDVIFDYAAGKAFSAYNSRKFANDSLTMMTLPLPVNTSGPESVKAAGKALDSSLVNNSWNCVKQFPNSIDDFKQCTASKQKPQRQLVRDSLVVMDTLKYTHVQPNEDIERESAMFAILYFLNNDYIAAKKAAQHAYDFGIKGNNTPTLPAFIVAACMLYDDKPNFIDSFHSFKYAITAEPENLLTPVLFSAYLERLSYRLNDRAATVVDLKRITDFSKNLHDDERKLAIQQILLAHYLMQIKVAQQRVISLTSTQNRSVLGNPKTFKIINASFSEYEQMLNTSDSLIKRQNSLLEALSSQSTWWKLIKSGKNPLGEDNQTYLDDEWSISLQRFRKALAEYRHDKRNMARRIVEFKKRLDDAQIVKQAKEVQKHESSSMLNWIKEIFK